MADVKIQTTRVACNTSTGTQDITISGFGTPKAALFILTKAITDGTAANDAIVGMGATDGTRQWTCASYSLDANGTTGTYRIQMTDKCVSLITSTLDCEAGFSAFITDGVQIDWTDAPGAEYLLTVVLFGGADLTARVDTIDLGTLTSPQTYSSMGFEADILILNSICDANIDSVQSVFSFSLGLVHNNGAGTITHGSQTLIEATGASVGQPAARMMTDQASSQINNSANVNWEVALSNFGSSGFDFDTNASADSDRLHFLAIDLGGAASAVGQYDPPTTATTSTISTSFTPQFCLLGLNACQAVDTAETDSDAGPFGIAVMDTTAQYCNSIAIEDAATTTNTQSLSDNQAINFPDHTGAGFYAATLDGMDSGGVDLNFSAADGTTRQWIYLAVEAGTGGGSTANYYYMQNQ